MGTLKVKRKNLLTNFYSNLCYSHFTIKIFNDLHFVSVILWVRTDDFVSAFTTGVWAIKIREVIKHIAIKRSAQLTTPQTCNNIAMTTVGIKVYIYSSLKVTLMSEFTGLLNFGLSERCDWR